MNVTAPRSTSSLFQVQSPRSEPSNSPRSAVTERPQSSVAREWMRDSFSECPCKLKARMLGLT